ncbi:MAG: trigger factor [Pseudomonadota bacterium]|nr:trigger factor [Pseudomonadota bacterium]
MQVSVESGEGLQRRMTVGLPPERVEAEVDKRLREFARTARLPGFRPGKVPVKVLRQRYGGQVQQEVFGELVQSSFSEALSQERLRPAAAPEIEPDIDQSEKRYAYTAVFEVLPQFELASLEGKSIKRPAVEVSDADLDAMIERLREQRKTWESVERAAQEGDKLTISFTGTMDGEEFEGGSAEDAEIELGSGRMMPGFESGLVGTQAGGETRLDLSFPEDYHAEHLKGKAVTFDVRVSEVAQPVLPEVDGAFARDFGVEDGDLERFRRDVRNNMERELKQRVSARIKNQVMDLLLESNQIDLPGALIKEEIQALKNQTRQNAGSGRLELPDDLFEDSARRRVALGLIIAEVVSKNAIKVDPERVRAAVEDMASTYEHPQDVIDFYYGNKENLASVETLTLEDQVVDWVTEQVSVEDEPGTFQELTEAAPAR